MGVENFRISPSTLVFFATFLAFPSRPKRGLRRARHVGYLRRRILGFRQVRGHKMQSKLLNRRDLDFILYGLLDVGALTGRPRFAEHSRETFDAALDTATKIAEEKFAPHNRKSDVDEPRF